MKQVLSVVLGLLVFGCLIGRGDAETSALPVVIGPADAAIRYVGRFDWRDTVGPRCSWPAATVVLKFQGTDLSVKLNAAGHDFWQVAIDGRPVSRLELIGGEHLYPVASGLTNGEHTVELVKATEGFVGLTQVLGFQMNRGAQLLAVPVPRHRLEVIGDSISAGYGNQAANGNEPFSPKTENAYFSYGAIAARQLGADYLCVAFSGRKMWPDNTIPELYDRTLVPDPGSTWDFARWTPDVVLINLATNDFWKENPAEEGWTQAYEAFIGRLRKVYPKAAIYCAIGTMMDDSSDRRPLTTVHEYLRKVVADLAAHGDQNVRIIDFGIQDPKNGLGANGHPSQKTHELMAGQLAATLRKDLGWQ